MNKFATFLIGALLASGTIATAETLWHTPPKFEVSGQTDPVDGELFFRTNAQTCERIGGFTTQIPNVCGFQMHRVSK